MTLATTRKQSASDLVNGNLKLSSPPLIYTKLMKVMEDPRSGSADLGNVISEDHGLAARVLALVNSALFALPFRVDNVSAAVRVVGTNQVRDIAVATSVLALFDDVPEDLIDVESFRHHSLAVAVAARALANQRREDNAERFFVAGLLHDIGKVVMMINAPDATRPALRAAKERGGFLRDYEREFVGCSHDQVGGTLLDKWRFPDALGEAVRYHHHPERASRFPIEAAAIHAADVIAHAMDWGRSGQIGVPPFKPAAWESLGIDMDLVPMLLDEIDRQLDAALALLPADGS